MYTLGAPRSIHIGKYTVRIDGENLKTEESKGVGGIHRAVTPRLSAALGFTGTTLAVHCDQLGEQG